MTKNKYKNDSANIVLFQNMIKKYPILTNYFRTNTNILSGLIKRTKCLKNDIIDIKKIKFVYSYFNIKIYFLYDRIYNNYIFYKITINNNVSKGVIFKFNNYRNELIKYINKPTYFIKRNYITKETIYHKYKKSQYIKLYFYNSILYKKELNNYEIYFASNKQINQINQITYKCKYVYFYINNYIKKYKDIITSKINNMGHNLPISLYNFRLPTFIY